MTTPSRDFYLAYLNSPAWRARRNHALRDAGYRCNRCPSKRDLEVHHKSYERLGAEWAEDLEVVCAVCHRAETLEHPSLSLGVYLKLVSQVVGKDPWARVSDVAEEVKKLCIQLDIEQDLERITTAINVVCGTRLKGYPTAKPVAFDGLPDRPITKHEAREFLARFDFLRGLIKTMPTGPRRAAGTRVIDIYGPVAHDEVEHDFY